MERPEIAPEPEPAAEVADATELRARAYADPVTGSDRLFAEAMRMQTMGQIGYEAVRDQAVSRYEEIRSDHPKA